MYNYDLIFRNYIKVKLIGTKLFVKFVSKNNLKEYLGIFKLEIIILNKFFLLIQEYWQNSFLTRLIRFNIFEKFLTRHPFFSCF